MFALWLGALAAAAPGAAADHPIDPTPSTLCKAGAPGDVIHVRVFPIGVAERIYPSPSEIIDRGGSAQVVRSFWRKVVPELCDANMPAIDGPSPHFAPRIVVFVDGEQDRTPLLLEYPDWNDNPAPVKASRDGHMFRVPASVVRKLLDYSRGGWEY